MADAGLAECPDLVKRPDRSGATAVESPVIQPRPRTIPEATVARLAVYLRVLTGLADGGRNTVSSGELASAGLQLMEERKITSLFVADEQNALVGILHIHDLWGLELF